MFVSHFTLFEKPRNALFLEYNFIGSGPYILILNSTNTANTIQATQLYVTILWK